MLTRKLGEIGSALFRTFIFPFIRIVIELKTKSIMKQKTYLNKGTVLRGKNFIGKNTVLTNVDVGYGTFIQSNSVVSNVKIGKYCSIASNLSIIGGKHPINENISTHPCFYAVDNVCDFSYINRDSFCENEYVDSENGYYCEIGNDVWIGTNVSILQGVHVGDGAVIGAGALVTKDVDAYGIYGGVPARKIGQRFSDEEIEKLLNLKWWDKDEAWIEEHANSFNDVKGFIKDLA